MNAATQLFGYPPWNGLRGDTMHDSCSRRRSHFIEQRRNVK
jgi:hypothetical protein